MYLSLIIITTKIANFFIKILHLGAGYTWPGYFALRLYPKLLTKLNLQYREGIILISGTNGKTTTSKLITHLLERDGYKVLHNRSGANLVNGIVTSLLLDMTLGGIPTSDVAVLEVDEFTLPIVLSFIKPTCIVLLNLSRDQLDRYHETDLIFERWKEALSTVTQPTRIVLYQDQKDFQEIKQLTSATVLEFTGTQDNIPYTQLVGNFNALNVNAAIMVGSFFGISTDTARTYLKDFRVAYGRGETIYFKGKQVTVFLAKNPASLNTNLDAVIAGDIQASVVLFILNDNIPDGRDVSWIYDIDADRLVKACTGKIILIAGTRCWDMAVRLQYAGLNICKDHVMPNLKSALGFFTNHADSQQLLVFPNYSAMLDLRKLLLGKRIL